MATTRTYDAAWAAFVGETAPYLRSTVFNEAPVRTGQFRSGIHVVADQNQMAVAAPGPLAYWLIKGTGIHGDAKRAYDIFPKRPGGVLRFVARDGTVVFTRHVLHPGMKPNPFHERAALAVIPKMLPVWRRYMRSAYLPFDTTLRPVTEISLGR